MKQFLLSFAVICCSQLISAQNTGPREITPQVLQSLKAEVEKQVPAFRQKLVQQEMTASEIEFSLDTFRIEQLAGKRMDIDYSTVGMNTTIDELTAGYDQLLNKYYNKLLKALNPEDKKVLIAAQKAWLAYRDGEAKLIGTMTKEVYSGGGTIQSNIATGSYSDLVVKRTLQIFHYYNEMILNR